MECAICQFDPELPHEPNEAFTVANGTAVCVAHFGVVSSQAATYARIYRGESPISQK